MIWKIGQMKGGGIWRWKSRRSEGRMDSALQCRAGVCKKGMVKKEMMIMSMKG